VDPPEGANPGFPLVMKVPRIGRGESTLGIESFEVEQMILPGLKGPHVPRVVATGDVATTPYIVMEWIEGVSLAKIVASGPQPPDEVARIGAALADATQSVHAQDIVHLDLKPENVMLRPSGEALLLDFGFSRHAHYPDLPLWLQEVILHCLENDPALRYQSAAHVALDLRHPDQVVPSPRAARAEAPRFFSQVRRWWRTRRNADRRWLKEPQARGIPRAVVILVAVDTEHPDDERHSPLQWMTRQIVSLNREYRLMCVSVIKSAPLGEGSTRLETATGKHLEHKLRLKNWVEPLQLAPSRVSLHVVEAANAADTLLELARVNHVDLIVLGAPLPSQKKLGWWRSAASTVTANAPCSVHAVRVPERPPL
jgi:nucleotide-binding universal stress UspA family protein